MTSAGGEDEATTEAARWLIALEEEPDNAELRARFEAWRAASPANAAAWANTSDVYELIGTPEYMAHREARRAWSGRRRRLVVGAALALAACLAFVTLPGLLLRLQADYTTSTAELQAHTLPDGSTVNLAPDSAIEVLYGGNDRGVRLLRGEALFEVRPDPSRPFRVKAGVVETTVLGTVFDVRLLDEGTVVAVREGKVRVDDRTAAPPVSESLEAGDWVRIERNAKPHRGNLPAAEVAAWRAGQIIARDRSIGDVVDELRRSYGGGIVITNGALARERVTGVYNLADPAAALRAAVGVYGGTVRQVSPWLLVVN